MSPLASHLYHGVADHFRLRAISWIMSFNMIGFGITLLVNPEVFALPGREMLYVGLTRIASPHSWALVCIAIGGFRVTALVINGTFPSFTASPYMRAVGSFFACLFWLQIVMGALSASSLILAVDVYATFLAFDVFSLYMATVEIEPRGDGAS